MKTASLIFTTYSMTRARSNRKSIYDFLAGFYRLLNAIETLFPSVTADLTTIQGDLGVEITLKHDAQHIPNEVIQELRAMFQRVALAVIHRRRQVSEMFRREIARRSADDTVDDSADLFDCAELTSKQLEEAIEALDAWRDSDRQVALCLGRWSRALTPEALLELVGIDLLPMIANGRFEALLQPILVPHPQKLRVVGRVVEIDLRKHASHVAGKDTKYSGRVRAGTEFGARALYRQSEITCETERLIDLIGIKRRGTKLFIEFQKDDDEE